MVKYYVASTVTTLKASKLPVLQALHGNLYASTCICSMGSYLVHDLEKQEYYISGQHLTVSAFQ